MLNAIFQARNFRRVFERVIIMKVYMLIEMWNFKTFEFLKYLIYTWI